MLPSAARATSPRRSATAGCGARRHRRPARLSARRTFSAVGPAFAALASLAVLIFVATRRPRLPLTDAVLVALLVSLVVNDTPGDVLGMGAVAAFVVRRFEDGSARRAPSHLVRLRAMRRPLTVLALLLAALALVAAGCGGDDVSRHPRPSRERDLRRRRPEEERTSRPST